MAARLLIEKDNSLDPKKKLTKNYCDVIDGIMLNTDLSLAVFERAIAAVNKSIAQVGSQAALDRRTAKMRDMRDTLRVVLAL